MMKASEVAEASTVLLTLIGIHPALATEIVDVLVPALSVIFSDAEPVPLTLLQRPVNVMLMLRRGVTVPR